MTDDFIITDISASRMLQEKLEMFTWNDNIYNNDREDPDWQRLYSQIYVTNIVLEEIMETSGDADVKAQLVGEAKVHRALAYFALANMHGLHYNPATAANNLAVPLRLGTDLENVDLSRASVQEIYALIIADIESAIEDLPETPKDNSFKHRPSKISAYTLLARIYLYMTEYEKSRDAANSALAINSTLKDYNLFTERSFFGNVIVYDLNRGYDDDEIIWLKASGNRFTTLIASNELYDLFEPNDLRSSRFGPTFDLTFIPDFESYALGAYLINGYKGSGFTVPEILLMRAECNVRLGQTSLAVNDLNTLREKRFATDAYTPITSTAQNEVLELVKRERRMELAGNGLRFFDIKRYNEFDNANITLTRTLNGKNFTLAPGSNNWAIPIGQKYILQNPEMGQNIRD
ncbi:RagB/SusD family nutrient uptake outer membrane protein [Polaribacter sp. Q13]|nr:RagB/SusD family nutrient uptake outer membrane protein [Polaribacter sp. Q13]